MPARILVVDDEQMLLRLVELALKNEGYQTITASNGPEALAKLKTEKVDLIVLDVMLPGMSGIDVCQQIRSQPETSGVPVIMLSALAQVADKIEGIRAGADEYITKPVDFRELGARVTGLLHRHAQLGALLTTPSVPTSGGEVIVVYGPGGGVGRTVIASNLAIALHQNTERSVLLADAHVQMGVIDLTLNLQARNNMLDLISRADKLDDELINTVVVRHYAGIHVVAAANQFKAAEVVTAKSLTTVLRKLSEMFDYVVVDLWPFPDKRTEAVLELASKVVLVVTPDIPVLRNARLFLDMVQNERNATREVFLTLNKDEGKVQTRDIEEALHYKLAVSIPMNAGLVTQSFDRGVPLVISQPKSAIARSIFQLADTVCSDGGGDPEDNGSKRRSVFGLRMFG